MQDIDFQTLKTILCICSNHFNDWRNYKLITFNPKNYYTNNDNDSFLRENVSYFFIV